MGFHGWNHEFMVPAKAAPATGAVKIVYTTEDGIVLARGRTVPSDAAAGYAPGCIFQHVNGSGATDVLYVNVGTKASANFDNLTVVVGGQTHITDAAVTATLTGVDTGTDMTAAQAATIVTDLTDHTTKINAILSALETAGILLTS